MFVPMPADLPLRGQTELKGPSSVVDIVDPSDGTLLLATWNQMLAEGTASCTIRTLGNPGQPVGMHVVDLTDQYDIYLGLFIGLTDHGGSAEMTGFQPRTSTVRKDELGRVLEPDEAATALLGWSRNELVGLRVLDIIHPDDKEKAIAGWMRLLARPGIYTRQRLRHQHRDGSWIWLEITNRNQLDDPERPHIRGEMVDVSAEMNALNALRTNERLLRRLTGALPVGVLYVDTDRRIAYRNTQLGAIVGVDAAETLAEQLAHVVPADRVSMLTAIDKALSTGDDADVEVSFQLPLSKVRRCLMSLRAVTDTDDRIAGVLACLVDITEDVNHREDLERRVRYDPLTGCLNHPSIFDELQRRLEQPHADTWVVALFVDLDEFKETNDRYGHVTGDRLLKHVATRLRQVAGDEGLVGRVGGDEFLMVVRTPANPRALTGVAGRVAAALDSPIMADAGWITPKGSIGLAYAAGIGADALDAAALVAAADAAMYRSKQLRDGTPIIARHAGRDDPPAG